MKLGGHGLKFHQWESHDKPLKPHDYEAVATATAKTANFVQLPHVYRYGVWVEVGLGLGWSLGWGGVWVAVGVGLGLDLGWGGVRVGVSLELGWDSVWGYIYIYI